MEQLIFNAKYPKSMVITTVMFCPLYSCTTLRGCMNEELSFKRSHSTAGCLLVNVLLFAPCKSNSLLKFGQIPAFSYDSTFYFTLLSHKCNPIPLFFCQHSLEKKLPVA